MLEGSPEGREMERCRSWRRSILAEGARRVEALCHGCDWWAGGIVTRPGLLEPREEGEDGS